MEEKTDLIWKYIDGDCSKSELELVNDLIKSNHNFAEELKQSEAIHRSLLEQGLESPSMSFTSNVIRSISGLSTQAMSFSFKKFFSGLVIAMAVIFGSTVVFPELFQSAGLIDYSKLSGLKPDADFMNWIPNNAVVFVLLSIVALYWADQLLMKTKYKTISSRYYL